jgi:hypothetical protein
MRPNTRPSQAPTPRPTVPDIQRRVGLVSRTLLTVHMLSLEIPDDDSLASRVGALAGLLGEQLDSVWNHLDMLVSED